MKNKLLVSLIAMYLCGCAQASVKYKSIYYAPLQEGQKSEQSSASSSTTTGQLAVAQKDKDEDANPKFYLQRSTVVLIGSSTVSNPSADNARLSSNVVQSASLAIESASPKASPPALATRTATQGATDKPTTPSASNDAPAKPQLKPTPPPAPTIPKDNTPSLKGVSGVIKLGSHKTIPDPLNTAKNRLEALSIPGEDQSALYAVVPKNQWLGLITTSLSIEYVPNTRLIKSVGSTVEDNRLKVIQAVGSSAAALAAMGILGGVAQDLKPPVFLDFELKDLNTFNQIDDQPEGWWYKFIDNSPNIDGVATKTYFHEHRDDGWFNSTSTFPKSACRSVFLALAYKKDGKPDANDPTLQFSVTVADPSLLWLYELPNKGKITSHDVCGADIAPDKDTSSTAWDLLSEAFKQTKAVYDAKHPATKK